MSQTIDGKEYGISELETIRLQQLDILKKEQGNIDAICELVCADALLCEEYPKDMGPQWLNSDLCKEICRYMPAVLEIPDKLMMAENVCDRAADQLWSHPRLKLRLLEYQREAIIAQGDCRSENAEMGIDDLSKEITRLQLNILAADQGRWDDITETRHLKRDPIEWSAAYEDIISEAQAKANKKLRGFPRGMGFCHAYWPTLQRILLNDYKINWRHPGQMNPGVLFD